MTVEVEVHKVLTLEIQINVLHVYLFPRAFSDQHALIETNTIIKNADQYFS